MSQRSAGLNLRGNGAAHLLFRKAHLRQGETEEGSDVQLTQ